MNNTVHYENQSVIFTDPCYLLKESTWSNLKSYDVDEMLSAFESEGYSRNLVLCDNTGVGDWCNPILKNKTGDRIGVMCADSGMFCIVSFDEVLTIAEKSDIAKLFRYNLGVVLPNYTGDIHYHRNSHDVAVIRGVGSVNFYSVDS